MFSVHFLPFSSPAGESNPYYIASVPGVLRALSSRTAARRKQKKYLIMILVPTEAVSLRAGLPEWGVLQLVYNINPRQFIIYMDFVPLIANAVAYTSITAKQRFANHTGAIPGVSPWISIITIKPLFAVAITLQYGIYKAFQFVGYIF